jgi:uncharacterized integral membrane protein
MSKNSNWFSVSRHDGIFLIAILLYVVVFFLPWSYDIKILNVSLLAWGAYLLFLFAPIIGICLAFQIKSEKITTQKENKKEIKNEIN